MRNKLLIIFIGILLISSVSASINFRVNGEYVKTSGENTYIENNLSVFDLTIRGGSSLQLAGAHFTNEEMFTSVDTDWGIHVDDEPTAFLGIYAHNNSPGTIANIILEAGNETDNSVFNIIKLNERYALGDLAFVNEDGRITSYVNHDSSFIWGHYDNLTKDDYGNLYNLEGTQRLMTLNDSSFNLLQVDLEVDGTATANYFIGDGSLLTNLPGGSEGFNSSRLDITPVHTKLFSPDGDYALLDNQQYVYNDGSRNRLEINVAGSMFVSPNGAETLIVGNEGLLYNMVEIATVNDINSNWDTAFGWGDHDGLYSLLNHKESQLFSPNSQVNFTLTNTGGILSYNNNIRFKVDANYVNLYSPNGDNFNVGSDIFFNGDRVLTTEDLPVSIVVSDNGLSNISVNNSGTYVTGYFTLGNDSIYNRDNLFLILQSPQKNHNLVIGNDAVTVDGGEVLTVLNNYWQSDSGVLSHDGNVNITGNFTVGTGQILINEDITIFKSPSLNHNLIVGNDAVTYDGAEVLTVTNVQSILGSNYEKTVAFVKFNPKKDTNGEVSYRNSGEGFRVFKVGTGTFRIENDGTALLSTWVTRSAYGSQAYISIDYMISGIPGVTVTIEGWASANGPNTGYPGTATIYIRNAAGTLVDVSNIYSNVYIKYVEYI